MFRNSVLETFNRLVRARTAPAEVEAKEVHVESAAELLKHKQKQRMRQRPRLLKLSRQTFRK
jgi:hypothetical protein